MPIIFQFFFCNFAPSEINFPSDPQVMKIKFINSLSNLELLALAKHEHNRIMSARYELSDSEIDFESFYSSFLYSGSRDFAFIRKALIALRDNI